ncbi:hypothetical protein ESCO_005454 [Escovopsis weberi]|uniref:VWFA domain-containing protein n=1 Tax=Escovopsis weberi TaxID=150374 RepID=A0A0M8N0E3_ESCWE|nr:hypothetical protein ESCO_005454 [Escovopsis weberi]
MIKSFLGSLKGSKPRASSSSSNAARPARPEPRKAFYQDAAIASNNDPPPAYATTAPNAAAHPPLPRPHASPAPPAPPASPQTITSDEDPYAFLSSFDTVFVIDDSGSMTGSSWRETEAALRAITPICTSHDADGVDVYFLNHRSGGAGAGGRADGGYYDIASPAAVERIFSSVRPYGITPTGARLQSILRPYLARLASARDADAVRPVNIIVITDGRATDDPESVIVQAAKKLDSADAPPHQVGIQFFQVGSERGAREALRELDDDLIACGVRDMVDAVTWDTALPMSEKVLSADGILKVVLGAVVRRLDRKSGVLK